MRFGSLFAGVGGFDIGLEAAGWECGWQVEWDKNCQQTLAYHWPNVPKWLDVSDVNGAELPPVDVITFGSPCQDLSVAGKRAGRHDRQRIRSRVADGRVTVDRQVTRHRLVASERHTKRERHPSRGSSQNGHATAYQAYRVGSREVKARIHITNHRD